MTRLVNSGWNWSRWLVWWNREIAKMELFGFWIARQVCAGGHGLNIKASRLVGSRSIWRLKLPHEIKIFLWLMIRDIILVILRTWSVRSRPAYFNHLFLLCSLFLSWFLLFCFSFCFQSSLWFIPVFFIFLVYPFWVFTSVFLLFILFLSIFFFLFYINKYIFYINKYFYIYDEHSFWKPGEHF